MNFYLYYPNKTQYTGFIRYSEMTEKLAGQLLDAGFEIKLLRDEKAKPFFPVNVEFDHSIAWYQKGKTDCMNGYQSPAYISNEDYRRGWSDQYALEQQKTNQTEALEGKEDEHF